MTGLLPDESAAIHVSILSMEKVWNTLQDAIGHIQIICHVIILC